MSTVGFIATLAIMVAVVVYVLATVASGLAGVIVNSI